MGYQVILKNQIASKWSYIYMWLGLYN
ncbi:hypothetical protein kac68v162_gp053 [Nodularia phage vB_NspS-kac68v162]|uniref:Uncharacterized protein n=2 Tax=Ravarandavirus kac68v161 TaxID=2845690 RepID=A0A482MIS9_9CAUD|nr:hypothetical protein HWC13_gp053 [Nodularia phage vB_NspS-kac68v161]QBQ73703.1 hypothetical protein kac68v161_gp053 [Nodularia phage vB_NspS-kac68v161]QBQ73901.1 hypothetical protein kac68v162_gp053 [Nodularia phage vB_NspS-kac68v162]